MICVKALKGAQELQVFLNIIGWESVLQVLPSEYYVKAPGDTRQIGAIRVSDPAKIIRESTYTVIFEDDITLDEYNKIQQEREG